MPVLETVENVQDQIIETIGSVQTRVIKTNKKIATQLNEKLGDRVPSLPSLPLVDTVTDRLPTPTVAVDTYFKLVERATKANHKFTLDLVDIWAPAKKTSKAAAKSTTKSTAKKTAAKASTKTTGKSAAKKRAVAKKSPAVK